VINKFKKMKKYILYLVLILACVNVNAQSFKLPEKMINSEDSLEPLTEEEISEIQGKVDEFYHKMQKQYSDYDEMAKQYYVEFRTDTFAIEIIENLRSSKRIPELEYSIIVSDVNAAYDVLLNKYYKLLRANLNEEKQEMLKQSQLNWLKFKTSELKLCGEVFLEDGSIGEIKARYYDTELIKSRTIRLFEYLVEISAYVD